MTEELLRLGIAAGLAIVILGGAYIGRRIYRRMLERQQGEAVGDLTDRYELREGQTTVMYLWGDRCAQCVQLQEPALERLSNQGDVKVLKLHAPSEGELLSRFKIATVPSTIVVGPDLRVRRVNVGFADEATLREQIA